VNVPWECRVTRGNTNKGEDASEEVQELDGIAVGGRAGDKILEFQNEIVVIVQRHRV
jgi:hypothetical protein